VAIIINMIIVEMSRVRLVLNSRAGLVFCIFLHCLCQVEANGDVESLKNKISDKNPSFLAFYSFEEKKMKVKKIWVGTKDLAYYSKLINTPEAIQSAILTNQRGELVISYGMNCLSDRKKIYFVPIYGDRVNLDKVYSGVGEVRLSKLKEIYDALYREKIGNKLR